MAEQGDGQERTEQPTPRRLKKAREKGQLARSRELNTMGVLLAGGVALFAAGAGMVGDLRALMSMGLELQPAQVFDPHQLVAVFREAVILAVGMLVPFLIAVAAAALLAPMALGGWSFAVTALSFKWEKMDPIKGLKRIFAVRGLVELLKALAKFLVVGGVTVLLLSYQVDKFLSLGQQSLSTALADAAWLIVSSFLLLCSGLVVIAAADIPFQLWDHARQLRMSHQEIKDEYKETEGKPEVKSRIRNLQREAAQRRMMEEVPDADVIVTNPTHYAVALKYDARRMAAPIMVAKGADLVAARIREVAAAHAIPVVGAPVLARAVYHNTELGGQVPESLYVAVAQILAYVYQLRRYRSEGGAEPRMPVADALQVPEGLRDGPTGRSA